MNNYSEHRYAVGDTVRLLTPDNERLHGAIATIARLESWGAHVCTALAATGNFRAAFCEMVPFGTCNGHNTVMENNVREVKDKPVPGGFKEGWEGRKEREEENKDVTTSTMYPLPTNQHKAVKKERQEQGYTGDICPTCGSFKMRRSGACSHCENCGTTSGCS